MGNKVLCFGMVSITVLGLTLAQGSLGQVIRPKALKDNPYRDRGGSCMYGKDGALLHAPVGQDCPDREDHFQSARSDAPAALLEGFPPALQSNVSEIFRDHWHIADEMARVRKAIEAGDRSSALAAVDKLTAEVVDHKAREEALLEKISAQRVAR